MTSRNLVLSFSRIETLFPYLSSNLTPLKHYLYTTDTMVNITHNNTRGSISQIRASGLSIIVFLGDCGRLVIQSVRFALKGEVNFGSTLSQMAAIGVDSIPIAMITTLSTGAVFAFYTAGLFVRFGATGFLGGTLTLSFLMELGPLLAGVTVAARSGAAIAAEIGSMVVTEQVDALKSMAVSPVRYLVAPRLFAAILMMPFIGVVADLTGVFGCFMMSVANGVPGVTFIESAHRMVSETEMLKGLIKTVVFGAIITVVSCRQGLRTKGGAVGVGQSTTSSVVLCVVLIFISDFFLAQMLAAPTFRGQ